MPCLNSPKPGPGSSSRHNATDHELRQRRRWRALTRRPARSWLTFGLVGALLSSPVPLVADDSKGTLDDILALDRRLAGIMYKLVKSSADLCPRQMPLTGIVLHTRNQYTTPIAGLMDREGWFPEDVAVALLVPGSPAEMAGIRPGDGLLEINGMSVQPAKANSNRTSEARDLAERQLADLAPGHPIALTLHRSGSASPMVVTFTPEIACRTRWEVTFDKATLALSDGDTIQITARFIAEEDDAAISVIAAHELAHTALDHRAKLEEQGVKYGALTAYGRSGRLIRMAEDEADRLSVQILRAAGYDPENAVDFWQGPGRRYAGGIFRSPTHASAKARAQAIKQEIARSGRKTAAGEQRVSPVQ